MPLVARTSSSIPTEVPCSFTCSRCHFTGPALATVRIGRGSQLQLPSLPVEARTHEAASHLVALAVCPRCGRRSPGAVVAFAAKLVAFVALPLWGLGWLLLDRLGLAPRALGTPGLAVALLLPVAAVVWPLARSLRKARRQVSFG